MLRLLLRSTRIPGSALPAPRAFLRDEEGALTIVGLIFFAVMIVAGGVAWDLMRSERDRAELQYAMDRATLAAAALDQVRDPKVVVEDYLNAAGIPHDSVRIQTFKDEERTRVTVHGEAVTQSLFMRTLGYDEIEAAVWSQAREEEVRTEVSLILDISGSMGSSAGRASEPGLSKNALMRREANNFVTSLVQDREDLTSVSVVSYNHAVNVGSRLAPYLNLSDEHNESLCVVWPQAAYGQTNLENGTVLTRMSDFDHRDNRNPEGPTLSPECPRDDYGMILPWSNNVAELTAHIDTLGAQNNTAVDLGVKWGALLLDPSMRDEHAQMITDGLVSEDLEGRPFEYGESGVQKVIVVMTDGRNTGRRDLKDYAKNGPTGIFAWNPDRDIQPPTHPDAVSNWSSSWTNRRGNAVGPNDRSGWWASEHRGPGGLWRAWDEDNNNSGTAWYSETHFSIWSPDENAFYYPHERRYFPEPDGGTAAQELSYQELFSQVSIRFIRDKWFEQVNTNRDDDGDGFLNERIDDATRNHFRNASRTTENANRGNSNLANICQAAGDRGILIYAIAFQAGTGGPVLDDCAQRGAPGSVYFDVDDDRLDVAFDEILASINLLKLTQ